MSCVSVSVCVYECVGCVRMEEIFAHAVCWRYRHGQVTHLAKIVWNGNICCHGRFLCIYILFDQNEIKSGAL